MIDGLIPLVLKLTAVAVYSIGSIVFIHVPAVSSPTTTPVYQNASVELQETVPVQDLQ